MASYNVVFRPSVEKDLESLPKATARRALARIEVLAKSPYTTAVKLSGAEKLFRVRVGDYRIVYEIDEPSKQLVIHYVRHRRDVYRNF